MRDRHPLLPHHKAPALTRDLTTTTHFLAVLSHLLPQVGIASYLTIPLSILTLLLLLWDIVRRRWGDAQGS